MGALEFIASLMNTVLSWPVLVLVVVLLFRRQFSDLIGRIRSYEGMGQKVQFGDALASAESLTDRALEEVTETAPSDGSADETSDLEDEPHPRQAQEWTSRLLSDASRNPSFVILMAWDELETAVARLASRLRGGKQDADRWPLRARLQTLQDGGVIGPDFVAAVDQLRELRNRVAHGRHNPTSGEAIANVESAGELTAELATQEAAAARPVDDLVRRWKRYAPENAEVLNELISGFRELGYTLQPSVPRGSGGPRTYLRALAPNGRNAGYLHSTSFTFAAARDVPSLREREDVDFSGRLPRLPLTAEGAAATILKAADEYRESG